MSSTATVVVGSTLVHKLYGKIYKRSRKYHVHDTLGTEVGDIVKFVSSKPYSKLKRWKIINVVGKNGKKAKTRAVKSNKSAKKSA